MRTVGLSYLHPAFSSLVWTPTITAPHPAIRVLGHPGAYHCDTFH